MDLVQEQRRRNAAADETWQLYAPHRTQVTQLIRSAASPMPRSICLLGAGNLNDIDLSAFAEFQQITLVDVDATAVRRGLIRQAGCDDARFEVIAPFDVTGAFTELESIKQNNELDRCLSRLMQTPDLGEHENFSVVASVGLLTQLIDAVGRTVGESHPRFWEVVAAVRAQHLRLMLNLTSPGGAAVLVTEVVSSTSCPELLSMSESELPELLRREISAKNFFTGTNPAALQHLLHTAPGIAGELSDVRFTEPWLWQFLARTYAVYGVTMRKRS